LYEIFSGLDPYPGKFEIVWFAKMDKNKPQIPESFSKDLKDLVSRGCSHEPTGRPGLGEFRSVFHRILTGEAATIQDEEKPGHTRQSTETLINQVQTNGCAMEAAECNHFVTESN
jgi:hypothetical protein